MTVKAKIGILFITSGWFRDVGLQTSSSNVTAEVEKIGEEIVQKLSDFSVPVYTGVLFSKESARKAAEKIKASDVDGVIISPLMWCEDQILRAALKKLPKFPTVICLFFPYDKLPEYVEYQQMIKGSGLVGVLQISGFLKKEEYNYQSVAGYFRDPEVYEKLKRHCLAFAIIRELRRARCGVLPFRCDQMSTTYVDEFAIRKLYGVELRYLEIQRLKVEAQRVSPKEMVEFEKLLKSEGHAVEVDEKNLNEGIKYALAMEKVIREENLNIFAMNDIIDEMHSAYGLRPCLSNPRISAAGVVVTMEGEVAAGIAMYILRLYTGKMPFYTEPYTADLEKNALLMGHPGYHSTINKDNNYPVKIVNDVEYENSDRFSGASTFFKYRPGPVTAVNAVFTGQRLRWTVFEGMSMEGPPKMEGTPHLFCQTKTPVSELCNITVELGISQHWVVVPGHYLKELEQLCAWLNIEYCAVE